MHPILQKNKFLIKEHIGLLKLSHNYDIFDPSTEEKIMECREASLGIIRQLFRFTPLKWKTPFHLEIKTVDQQKILSLKRGICWGYASTVNVFDENDIYVGTFKEKFFSKKGRFQVYIAEDSSVGKLTGTMTDWNFNFYRDYKEIAQISKRWGGYMKELFTTADSYTLNIDKYVPYNSEIRIMAFAAVFCIDMVLREGSMLARILTISNR